MVAAAAASALRAAPATPAAAPVALIPLRSRVIPRTVAMAVYGAYLSRSAGWRRQCDGPWQGLAYSLALRLPCKVARTGINHNRPCSLNYSVTHAWCPTTSEKISKDQLDADLAQAHIASWVV